MQTETNLAPKTFYDIYSADITPKLKEIDLLVKTSARGISVDDAACALELSHEEIQNIMDVENISKINKKTFFKIMLRGSSEICRYFSREVRCGSPLVYTKKDIAYIYGLNLDDVTKACEKTGIKEATAFTLPRLFSQIPIV